ncbi:hypothetical protein [Pseudoxanthomonas sp. SORGH_AS_0997]|uniref:hypothetical protein n=1 Tax=Pseudoxanthomonas sp. SORGH_AS_0997 TaxID=3041776 RepID=UPI002859214A|nr:hypothetical protein [Pseudoxanthomonas sp. SORGH_AS_0997]MDR6139729.1 hypothetical protein [Pseudoxanthomonas sp. SORGH_AS_0997]
MTELDFRLMLFVKDFTGRGADLFYWFFDGQLQETDATSIVEFAGIVVCHDVLDDPRRVIRQNGDSASQNR